MRRDLAAAREVAVALAVEVGAMQVAERGRVTGLEIKAHANDLVSHVDIASEKRIVEGLLGSWPDDGILGEECHQVRGSSGWRWVIDPLDGTRNYLNGAGPWSVSIALLEGEATVLGVVHDPALGETFSAITGRGATLNDAPIGVSTSTALAGSLVGLSFNPSPPTKIEMAAILGTVLPVSGDIRRIPSALGLSYLAGGRFDAELALDTQTWDIAGAAIIAAEAGAVLGGRVGTPPHALTVAAGRGLWAEFAAVLEPHLGPLAEFTG